MFNFSSDQLFTMIFQLDEDDYPKLQPLVTIPPLQLNIGAFIERNSKANIWVDDSVYPKTAYIWDTGYRHYLIGDTTNQNFNNSLSQFLKDELLPEIRIKKKYFYLYLTDRWRSFIPNLNLNPSVRERFFFRHSNNDLLNDEKPDLDNLVIEQVTVELLKQSHLSHVQDIITEIEESWPSLDKFFEVGFGYCLRNEQTIAGWCLGEYFSRGNCGVGIETYPEFQNKGYGTLLASKLVKIGKERGLDIYWDSWNDNYSSNRVAEKIGFEHIYEYDVYFGSFDRFLNLIIPGDIAYRHGKFDKAIKIYLQAVEMKPEENWLYWNIAINYQKQGLTKQVFEYLHKAIEYGFTSLDQFENSPHFKDLHHFPEWKKLILELKAKY
jgi:RimJ/RimL family protein N-acetyltransferase